MSYRAVRYRDAWRKAHQLVLDHCDDAAKHALKKADTALASGDRADHAAWCDVLDALADMGRSVSDTR